jgi:hypothetical protein
LRHSFLQKCTQQGRQSVSVLAGPSRLPLGVRCTSGCCRSNNSEAHIPTTFTIPHVYIDCNIDSRKAAYVCREH